MSKNQKIYTACGIALLLSIMLHSAIALIAYYTFPTWVFGVVAILCVISFVVGLINILKFWGEKLEANEPVKS